MDRADEVTAIIERMDQAVDCAIVEGPHDRDALRTAGFTGTIEQCAESDGLVGFAKRVARSYGTVAILTDYDEEGTELNRTLQEYIPESRNDKRWRQELGKVLTQDGRRDIEAINNLLGAAQP